MITFFEKTITFGLLVVSAYFSLKTWIRPSYVPVEVFAITTIALLGLFLNIDKIFVATIEDLTNSFLFESQAKQADKALDTYRSQHRSQTFRRAPESESSRVNPLPREEPWNDSDVIGALLTVQKARSIAQTQTEPNSSEIKQNAPQTPTVRGKYHTSLLPNTDNNQHNLDVIDSLIDRCNPNNRVLVITNFYRADNYNNTLMAALDGTPNKNVLYRNVRRRVDLIPNVGHVNKINLQQLIQFLLQVDHRYDEVLFVTPQAQMPFYLNLADRMNQRVFDSLLPGQKDWLPVADLI